MEHVQNKNLIKPGSQNNRFLYAGLDCSASELFFTLIHFSIAHDVSAELRHSITTKIPFVSTAFVAVLQEFVGIEK